MLNVNKRFEQELLNVEFYRNEFSQQSINRTSFEDFFWFLLKKFFEQLGTMIFEYNEGGIVVNKNGNPKINWVAVLVNLQTIIAKFAAIITEYNKFKTEWRKSQ